MPVCPVFEAPSGSHMLCICPRSIDTRRWRTSLPSLYRTASICLSRLSLVRVWLRLYVEHALLEVEREQKYSF